MEKSFKAEAAPDHTEPATDAKATEDAGPQGQTAASQGFASNLAEASGYAETPAKASQMEAKPKEATPEEPKKEAPKEATPEKYADFKGPEGFTVDPQMLGKFNELAKSAKLTQEQAQSFYDMGAAMVNQIVEAAAAEQDKQDAAFLEQAKKEFPAEKLGVVCDNAKQFIADTLKDKAGEFQKVLKSAGLANHPGLIKLLDRAYRATREDVSPRGQAGANKGDRLAILYPSLADVS